MTKVFGPGQERNTILFEERIEALFPGRGGHLGGWIIPDVVGVWANDKLISAGQLIV